MTRGGELFERRSRLPAEPDRAWLWHASGGAFARLAPPWQNLRIEYQEPLAEGSRLSFRMRRGPISLRWVAVHRDVEPGRGFTDVQEEGPFARWEHRHEIRPTEEGSELVDRIHYDLPGGAVGRAIAGRAIRRDLRRLFDYRARVLQGDLALHGETSRRPLSVAVSGASGLVGRSLVALLETGGHRVTRLVRRSPGPGEVQWSPERPVDFRGAAGLKALDAVVHLAGESISSRWTSARRAEIRSSRIDGTRQLIESLATLDTPPARFLCASATGFYGDRGAEVVEEDAPAGEGFLATVCQGWEGAARGARSIGSEAASLRFGVVISPAGGALGRMLPAFQCGLGGRLGTGRQFLSWISLDDAVSAILSAIVAPRLPPTLNLVAPEPVRQADFARTLGRVLGRPAVVPVPAVVLSSVLGEMATELLLASTRVQPRALRELGYRFRHPQLETALRHVLGRSIGPGESA